MWLLNFLLWYITFLFIWLVINTVSYALCLVFKKAVFVVPYGLNTLVNFGIQIYFIVYPLYFIWQIIVAKQWLLLIFFLFAGGLIIGFYQAITSFLTAPFGFITLYFSEKSAQKMKEIEKEKDVVVGEILDENSKVVGTTETDVMVTVKMAKFFLGVYLWGLVYIIFFPAEREGLLWWSYITKPFGEVIKSTIFFGLFYLLFHKIKYKRFFPSDKRYFFIKVWKITLYIYIPISILLYFFASITGTL